MYDVSHDWQIFMLVVKMLEELKIILALIAGLMLFVFLYFYVGDVE